MRVIKIPEALLNHYDPERNMGGRRDLNPQPLAPQASALPLSYDHHVMVSGQWQDFLTIELRPPRRSKLHSRVSFLQNKPFTFRYFSSQNPTDFVLEQKT